MRGLGLKTQRGWNEWSKSGQRPYDIPGDPFTVYRDDGESMPRLKARVTGRKRNTPTPISMLTKVSRFQQFFYVATSLAVVTDSLVALSYTAAADKENCVPLHLCNPRLDDVYRNQTDRC